MDIIKKFATETFVSDKIETELNKLDFSALEPKDDDIPILLTLPQL